MGKLRRVLRCYHCGAVLQTEDENEKGYIRKTTLQEGINDERVLYCNPCYDAVKALNLGKLEKEADDEILSILDDAKATDALIVWVVDLFSFGGYLSNEIVKKIKKLPLMVIGTKFDLFPKRTKEASLRNYIQERFDEAGLKILEVEIVGNTNAFDATDLLAKINELRKNHDVYMIGTMASGKTTLINKLLKSYTNKSKHVIKTQIYPNTKQKVLEIPLSNSTFLYELPSFSLVNSVVSKVEKEVAKFITPHAHIEVDSKTLEVGETLMIGSLAGISLIEGKDTSFKVHTAEKVEIKRIKTKDIDEFLSDNFQKRFLRPVSERLLTFKDYDVFEYVMENDGQVHDINVTGLGWVSFVAKGQIVRIFCPKGTTLKECLGKIR